LPCPGIRGKSDTGSRGVIRLDSHSRWIRIERWNLWPLRLPMDNDTANTECSGMLGRIVLDNTFKPIILGSIVASVAKKDFLTVLLCMRLDFGVKDPFHVLQNEFPGVGSMWGIHLWFPPSCTNSSFILSYLGIESLSDVDQDLCGKLWRVFRGYLITTVPAITNDLIGIPTYPCA
jgi:hypothetical protein